MVNPPKVASSESSFPGPPECRSKVRIRFAKDSDLRFISHHDLMQIFERMFRRADLPVLFTQGFNPHPRITFALSLAVGLAGRAEVAEVDLAKTLDADAICQRLRDGAPAGLKIISVQAIEPRKRARVRRAFYRIEIPAERRASTGERIQALLDSPACWVNRSLPRPRWLNLRPYISTLRLVDEMLEMVFWVSPYGTVRPEEILGFLFLNDLLKAGCVVERTNLELEDETPDTGLPPALLTPGEQSPGKINGLLAEVDSGQESVPQREPRPSTLIPGPMSFDS